eukprot:gene18090-19897_t
MSNIEHDSSDGEWSDVEEEHEVLEHRSFCLFCEQSFELSSETVKHMDLGHAFNIIDVCQAKKLDFYSYIKLVNYIRSNKIDSAAALKLEKHDFEDDKYFKPILEDDMLLQIDSDILESGHHYLEGSAHDEQLEGRLKQAEERALRAEESLARAVNDLSLCRSEMLRLVMSTNAGTSERVDGDTITEKDDANYSTPYFESYAHHGIHEEMLKDSIRTEAYKKFITSNTDAFKGKVVLDIGCGTGILSMFAAKAGAKRVFAIDQSEIAYHAMEIVRENNLDDIVKVTRCKAEDFTLPKDIDKVDIIISEWMGYFLLFESMLDTILTCRDKFLGQNVGMVYPDVCGISLAALCDEDLWNSKIDFWDDVYGCEMTCMKKYVVREAMIDVVAPNNVISQSVEVINFDLMKAQISDLDYEKEFELQIKRKARCTGIVGYFDIGFQSKLSEPISFSTGYESPPTHWKQTVFLFEKKFDVDEGNVLECAVKCNKDPKDPRSLIVKLHVVKQSDKSQAIKQLYVIN